MRPLYFVIAAVLIFTSGLSAGQNVTIKAPPNIKPMQFGVKQLRGALQSGGYDILQAGAAGAEYEITAGTVNSEVVADDAAVPRPPQSFALIPRDVAGQIIVAGSDEVGVMYGLLELAERVNMGEKLANIEPDRQAPFLAIRAVNPFLSLPYPFDGEWNDWWFRSEDFWRTYLDMLARARINWIDIHGMYDIKVTNFPNIYPYFIDSPSFPEVGIDDRQKAKNLRMLQRVIEMAKARGIKIGLMSYHASWDVPGAPKVPYEQTDENLAGYTRECVAGLLRACPDLGMIGFRIGESGKSGNFYKNSYLPAIIESGLNVPLHTRTWGANRKRILRIGRNYGNPFYIEIKYNGEHFGQPYIVSGGRMAQWGHYSYQNYARPPQQYQIVWQIRANGTHRLFRWGNPQWVSRCMRSCKWDGATGFSLEAINSYYPHYDYYHKAENLKWFDWVVERDWFWYLLWGRLAYNPDVTGDVWQYRLGRRFGSDAAGAMFRASKNMSKIVPLIYSAHCLGPDHRNFAPEFETGGPLDKFINVQPLDTFSVQSVREYVRRVIAGNPSPKTTPLQMADMIQQACDKAEGGMDEAAPNIERASAEFADWKADITCLSHLGRYYAHKLRAAVYLQLYRQTRDSDHWQEAKLRTLSAIHQWSLLSKKAERYYKPFVDTLRMHTENFHWKNQLDEVKRDAEIIKQVKQQVSAAEGEVIEGIEPEHLPEIEIDVSCGKIKQDRSRKIFMVRVSGPKPFTDDARAYLRLKHLPSEMHWRRRPMKLEDGVFERKMKVLPIGMQWAVEVITDDGGVCWPDWREETPYRLIEAWGGRVPDVIDRGVYPVLWKLNLSRDKYRALVVGREAHALHTAPQAQKKQLLKKVKQGQSLIIFNQDFPQDFDPSWLPGSIKMTDDDMNNVKLIARHPILDGLPDELHLHKIVNDALGGKDDNWRMLTDPAGISVRGYGEGKIVFVQLRVLETVDNPHSAQLVRNVVNFAGGGSDRPVFLLDDGNGVVRRAFEQVGIDYETPSGMTD